MLTKLATFSNGLMLMLISLL